MENYYNKKRINPPIWQHDYHVLKLLYRHINNLSKVLPENQLIVDYGCGTSPYSHLFKKNRNRYLRVDIGQNKLADIKIKEGDLLPLKKASADLILSTQVLEHVNDLNLYLSECARILKKSGRLLISTHGIWPYHPSPEDYRRFTSLGLRYEIEKHGFKILNCFRLLGPFSAITQYTLLVIADYLSGKNLISRILLAVISVTGNVIISLENIIIKGNEKSDAAVFLIWAEKK